MSQLLYLRITFAGPAVYSGERRLGRGFFGSDVVAAVASDGQALTRARGGRIRLRIGLGVLLLIPVFMTLSSIFLLNSLTRSLSLDQRTFLQWVSVCCSVASVAASLGGVLTMCSGFNLAARAVDQFNGKVVESRGN
jgi:hypothetical protein